MAQRQLRRKAFRFEELWGAAAQSETALQFGQLAPKLGAAQGIKRVIHLNGRPSQCRTFVFTAIDAADILIDAGNLESL